MLKRNILTVSLGVALAMIIFPKVGLGGVGDVCYRPEFGMNGPLFVDGVKWAAGFETVIKNDVQEASCIALIGGVEWTPVSFLSLTPEYYRDSKGGTPDSNEDRIRLNAEFKYNVGPIKLAFRNRFEYRMKENSDDFWRYRPRLKVSFPKILTVTPFIYEEPFYDFLAKDWNGNEAGIGGSVPLAKDFKVDVDLRTVNARKDGRWGDTDLHLLTTFKYSF